MQVQYRGYLHTPDIVGVRIDQENHQDEALRTHSFTTRFTLNGEVQADTQVALLLEIAALEAAYAVPGGPLILYDNSGNVAASLSSVNSISGVRIVSFSYPEDGRQDAEFSTFRRFTIVLECEYELELGELLAWEEKLRYIGTGAARSVYVEPRTGIPQRQIITQASVQQVIQEGRAVGRSNWPTPPLPTFPFDEDPERRVIELMTPKRFGPPGSPLYREFEITWHYEFRQVLPFNVALPNQWPAGQ